jgi:hypothetical protein
MGGNIPNGICGSRFWLRFCDQVFHCEETRGYCQPKRIQSCLRPLPRFGEVSRDRSVQAALETEIYNRAPKL